jgi:hypothetical protein
MIDLATTSRQFIHVDEFATAVQRTRRTIYYWIQLHKISLVETPLGKRIPIAEARRIYALLQEEPEGRLYRTGSRPDTTSCASQVQNPLDNPHR